MQKELPFSDAAEVWLRDKAMFISKRTKHDYDQYLKPLRKFFGVIPLESIHIGNIREYQQERSQKAGGGRVNMEIGALRQVLKEAGCWEGSEIEKFYQCLPQREDMPGVALAPEDEAKLFFVAQTRKRWLLAYCCGLICANTTLTEATIKNLKLADINLNKRKVYARKAVKNKFRIREIDLNDAAFYAIKTLYERCIKLHKKFGVEVDLQNHVLLPHRAHLKGECPDFARPMYGIRRAWVNLREAAGFPTLRFYDLRHTAITKLLENPDISEATVIDIAGHVNNKMLRRYSHIRAEKRKSAVGNIDTFSIMKGFFNKRDDN